MILILAYHSISNQPYRYATPATVFERQLSWLQKHYRFVALEELITILSQPKQPSENIAHVTFDDGLQDNLTEGLPVLQKLHIPGTIFVPTSMVGTTITNPGTGLQFPVLTWDEMRILESSGLIRCESHTDQHPILSQCKEGEIMKEFASSKELLERNLQKKVVAIAYPKGEYDQRVMDIAKKYFAIAFGPTGVNLNWPQNMMKIARITISTDVSDMKFKLMSHPLFWRLRRVKKNYGPN